MNRLDWKGRYFEAEGAELYVESHGNGEPLICLHNFSANGRSRFEPLLPRLASSYTCHLVDLRAHGRSTNHLGRWDHALIAQDIIHLSRQIAPEGGLRYLAASSGAMAMLRVARERPDLVRAMVLDSSTYRIPEEVRRNYKDPATLSDRLKEYYRNANEVYGPEYGPVLAQIFYDFRLPECDINQPLEALHEIAAPTLLIAGDRDIFFPANIHVAMKQAVPDSQLFVAPSTGHIVMEAYPDLVASLALEFFKRRT